MAVDGLDPQQWAAVGTEDLLSKALPSAEGFSLCQQDWGRDFNILLTLKCPLSCAHCSVRSSPHRKELLSGEHLALLLRMMVEFKSVYPTARYLLTGGEPFLHREALGLISEAAADAGLAVGVETSGYWAASLKGARGFISKYPWISSYLISADVYHLPFLSPQVPINAWLVAKEAGCEAKIRLVVHADKTEEDRSLIRELRKVVPEQDLIEETISPVGRATEHLSENIFPRTDRVPAMPCPAEGPLVRETGRVDPCCSAISTLDNHPLILGHLAHDSAKDIFNRYESNALLHVIRLWGMPGLLELLRGSQVWDKVPKRFVENDTCFACYEIFKIREIALALEESAGGFRTRFEVAVGRAILLGEDALLERMGQEFRGGEIPS